MSTSDKLPRGLWVGKIKRRDGTYHPEYRYRIRLKYLGGQVLRNTHTTVRAEAVKTALLALKAAQSTFARGQQDRFRALMDETSDRQVWPSVGTVLDTYLDGSVMTASHDVMRRNASALLLVIRTVHECSNEEARAMPATVVNADLAREFQRVRQGGTRDIASRAEGNTSINSTLTHARGVFSRAAMSEKYGKLRLPDTIAGFREVMRLKTPATQFTPIPDGEYRKMDKASRELRLKDPEMWLVNQLLRRLGLRSKELQWARGTWLEQSGGQLYLLVQDRPDEGFTQKGVLPRRLPVAADLAAVLLPRMGDGFLILPDGGLKARENLVRARHNAWLKRFITVPSKTSKANHLLRKHIGSVIYTTHGVEAAAKYLGHTSTTTTEKWYVAYTGKLPVIEPDDIAAAPEIKDAA